MSYSNRSSFFLKVKSIAQDKSSSIYKKIASGFFVLVALLIFCIPVINKKLQYVEDFFDGRLSSIHNKMAIVNSNVRESKKKFFDIFSLIETNEKLRNENEKLSIANAQLAHVMLENESFKAMNNFVFPKTKKILSTRLIFRSDSQIGMAKIFAGKADGIKPGQIIVSSSGALVGKIISVSNNTSKLLLINEPKSRLSVSFPRINNKAILSGNYGENLKITLAETPVRPENGDVVITSGDDGYFPAGLLVGTVKMSDSQEMEVVPMITPSNVDLVSVLELDERN